MAAGVICKACGQQNWARRVSPSSFIAEIFVWLIALVAAALIHWSVLLVAFAFSIWRFAAPARVCGKCGSRDIIPIDSPIGRQLLDQAQSTYRQHPDRP